MTTKTKKRLTSVFWYVASGLLLSLFLYISPQIFSTVQLFGLPTRVFNIEESQFKMKKALDSVGNELEVHDKIQNERIGTLIYNQEKTNAKIDRLDDKIDKLLLK